MKRLALILIAAAAVWAQKPGVSRSAMVLQEESFDTRIKRLSLDDPFNLLGNTRGVYLEKYGAVLSAEVGLALVPGITPFHSEYTQEDRARVRNKKLQRVPLMKQVMMEQLIETAKALDMLPDDDQIVLAVTLFYWSWEDKTGLPLQIVMQAPRKVLLANQKAAIRVQEF